MFYNKNVGFRDVFLQHASYVSRALQGLGVPENDVEDAMQQTFVVVYRRLNDLVPTVPIRAFLYGICLRVAAEFRRRSHWKREHLVASPPDSVVPAAQEATTVDRETLQWLQQVLNRLDDSKRDVFVLYEIEGVDMREVANKIGCPLQTAYSRLHSARKEICAAYSRNLA